MLNSARGCLLLALLFCLAGCASGAAVTEETALADAISGGVIADINSLTVKDTDYDLGEVVIGRISRKHDVTIRLFSPNRREEYFKNDGGRLKGVYVTTGDRVQKGDVLAEIIFDVESLTAQREQLLIKMRRFEQDKANEDAQHQKNLMTQDAELSDELAALKQAQRELAYKQFLFDAENTRAEYNKHLADIDEKLAGEQITAAFDGIIRYVHSAKNGSTIRNWTHIITIEDDSALLFSTQGPVDVLRYGDVFEVESRNHDLKFEVKVVYDPICTDTRDAQYTYVLAPVDEAALCAALAEKEIDDYTLNTMSLTGYPFAFNLDQVLIAPKRAVKQEDTKQFVYIYEDGIVKKRYVKTYLNYQDEIQILDGLSAGQMVVLN